MGTAGVSIVCQDLKRLDRGMCQITVVNDCYFDGKQKEQILRDVSMRRTIHLLAESCRRIDHRRETVFAVESWSNLIGACC